MDKNKQDLPKKLVEPFGLSCQFESGGSEAFFLSERKRIQRERGQKCRARGLCGGSVEAGALFKQRKVQ